MTITLLLNNEPNNKINKSPSNPVNYSGNMRNETDIINPVIIVTTDSLLPSYNYMYIPDFNRYYFIDNIKIIRTGIIEIYGKVDVLKSYANEIMGQNVIISKSSDNGTNYLNNPYIQGLCKETTNVLNFPNGLNDSGEFILITAGG
jgi:hypothetical protein